MSALVAAVLVGVLTALTVYLGEFNVPQSINHGMDIVRPLTSEEVEGATGEIQSAELRKQLYVCEFVSQDTSHITVRELPEVFLVSECTEVGTGQELGKALPLD